MVFEYQEKNQKSLKRKIALLVILVLSFSIFALAYSYLKEKDNRIENEKRQFFQGVVKGEETVFINETSNITRLGSQQKNVPEGIFPESENFILLEASLGEDYVGDISGFSEKTPLEIFDVRSEMLSSRDGKESLLLIYWKTNRPARSKVIYKKTGSSLEKELKEDGVGVSHALVISKFDLDTRYLYRVEAEDRWMNKAQSKEFAAYSGKRKESVIELISGEFKEIFGWMEK